MQIIEKKISELTPYKNNPRMNDDAVAYVANSIKQFGFKEDICVINNKYIVAKSGRVYTINFNKKGIKEQKLRKHTNGYLRATMYGKDRYVHRLVAMCFIDNPKKYKEISHEDNDKKNNNVSNLKWCDRSYNNKKMFIDGIRTNEEMKTIARSPRPTLRKLRVEQIKEIRNSNESDTKLAKEYKISRGAIYGIRKIKSYREVVQ